MNAIRDGRRREGDHCYRDRIDPRTIEIYRNKYSMRFRFIGIAYKRITRYEYL